MRVRRTRTNLSAISANFSRRTTCPSNCLQSTQGTQRSTTIIGLPDAWAWTLPASRLGSQPLAPLVPPLNWASLADWTRKPDAMAKAITIGVRIKKLPWLENHIINVEDNG